jgi:hypothetical protein
MKINWLASYPKSGNTWVRAFLDAYALGGVDINKMREVLGDGNVLFYQQASPVPFDQLELYQWLTVRAVALFHMTAFHADRDRLILKTHNINAQISDMPTIPAGFSGPSVYLIRDPRDVVVSYAAHQGNSIDDMIEYMQNYQFGMKSVSEEAAMGGFVSSWDKNVTGWASYPDIEIIKYEDMKNDPAVQFERIVKQFGYEYSAKKVDTALEVCAIEKLKAQENAEGFKEATKNTKFFGRDHTELTDEQRVKIEEAFGPTMEKYGYL